MRFFLDTSVLVAAVISSHESHARSFSILEQVQDGKDEGFIAGHSLAEMYSVLTKMPFPLRHSPEQAYLSIEENILKHFKLTTLSGAEYATLARDAALSKIYGGTIYDAVLVRCAIKSAADRIYILNLRHFHSIAPPGMAAKIVSP